MSSGIVKVAVFLCCQYWPTSFFSVCFDMKVYVAGERYVMLAFMLILGELVVGGMILNLLLIHLFFFCGADFLGKGIRSVVSLLHF